MSDSTPPTQDDLARQARQHIDSLRAAGVEWVPDPSTAPAAGPFLFADMAPPAEPASTPAGSGELTSDERRHALAVLAEEVAHCTRCTELASTRTQTVFGVGPVEADICFLGEAPGADEDARGEPFVGAAGQLLNRIITAMGLKREEVFICNILRCRPPGNRQPLAPEAANCREFLDRTLQLVRPRVIVGLGGSAVKFLLDTSIGITKLRGLWKEYQGVPVMCTYHPSYLLRLVGAAQLKAKTEVWEDMKNVLTRLGKPVPQP